MKKFQPKGVCAKEFHIDVQDGILRSFRAVGGCDGNLQAVGQLVKDMPVSDVIDRLKGIRCGFKSTSCADQLAIALGKISPVKPAPLEAIEWIDLWWDEASKQGKRALLIGDSITRDYRPYVKEILGDAWRIDMIAASRAVDNTDFLRELNYVLQKTSYDLIHFNNGLHGFHLGIEEYAAGYEVVLKRIIEKGKNAEIVLGLSTAVGSEHYVKNEVIYQRNRVVADLAERYHLRLNDLYTITNGRQNLQNEDGIHYGEEGCKMLARTVCETVFHKK